VVARSIARSLVADRWHLGRPRRAHGQEGGRPPPGLSQADRPAAGTASAPGPVPKTRAGWYDWAWVCVHQPCHSLLIRRASSGELAFYRCPTSKRSRPKPGQPTTGYCEAERAAQGTVLASPALERIAPLRRCEGAEDPSLAVWRSPDHGFTTGVIEQSYGRHPRPSRPRPVRDGLPA
jgi:hypothetical protein